MSKRFLFVVALIVLGALSLSVVWVRHAMRSSLTHVDWEPISGALAVYVRDVKATDGPVPEFVTLSELVRKGYLHTNALAGFAGAEVTLRLRESTETFPQEILARAVMPDGESEVVLLGDGSVHQRKVKK